MLDKKKASGMRVYNVGQRGREDHPTSRVDESYPLEQ